LWGIHSTTEGWLLTQPDSSFKTLAAPLSVTWTDYKPSLSFACHLQNKDSNRNFTGGL